MKCVIPNFCDKKYLCCAFCKTKCEDRCRDVKTNCKYFVDIKCDLKNPEDLNRHPLNKPKDEIFKFVDVKNKNKTARKEKHE